MGGSSVGLEEPRSVQLCMCIDTSIIIEGLFILPVFYSLIEELCSCFRAVDLEMETLCHL